MNIIKILFIVSLLTFLPKLSESLATPITLAIPAGKTLNSLFINDIATKEELYYFSNQLLKKINAGENATGTVDWNLVLKSGNYSEESPAFSDKDQKHALSYNINNMTFSVPVQRGTNITIISPPVIITIPAGKTLNKLSIDGTGAGVYNFGSNLLNSINGGANATGKVVNNSLTFQSGSINEKSPAFAWAEYDLHVLRYNISGTTDSVIVSEGSQITIVAPFKNNKNR